ncbi:MAG TPA: hypothetical protein VNW29_08040 [Candidatus Sulfotelmatobacter sp.]|jgi:hypothetical protein|nr:hypothetical protein [Candidatus Sulfotelmatobacter sp.]
MLKHIWTVLCRKSVIDSETNNISLNEVMEQIALDLKLKEQDAKNVKTINLPLEFEVVSMLFKETKKLTKADLKVEFINPQNKIFNTIAQTFEMPETMRRMRTRIRVLGLAVEESGDYIFRVSLKEEEDKTYKTVAEVPLEVHVNKIIDTQPN